jgi:hypothetical protein
MQCRSTESGRDWRRVRRYRAVASIGLIFGLEVLLGCMEQEVRTNPGNEQCEYDDGVALPERYQGVDFEDCGVSASEPLPHGECKDSTGACSTQHARECVLGQKPGVDCSPCDAWVCDCLSGRYSCWLQYTGASPCRDPDEDAGARRPGGANCALPERRAAQK